MKEKISLIQMDVELGQVEGNYEKAVQLMELALEDKPDILVLPETLNTGFFPSPDSALYAASDADGAQTKKVFGAFAKEHGVNIVAGSVSVLENGCVFNRSYIFDRKGEVVASYDKIHGFSPMGETKSYTGGSSTVHFTLDGIACSMAICYDVRFCELIRTEALQGVDLFFLPAAWPLVRKEHWITLSKARAIENQMFFCAVNECGRAGSTQYGGNSMLLSPLGKNCSIWGKRSRWPRRRSIRMCCRASERASMYFVTEDRNCIICRKIGERRFAL